MTNDADFRCHGGAVRVVSDALICLAVGLADAVFPDGMAECGAALSIDIDQLAGHLPLPLTVELVVVPLFCARFDALEIIEILGLSGYRGALRVVTPKLPNRQIVLRELRSHAVRQGITLELKERT